MKIDWVNQKQRFLKGILHHKLVWPVVFFAKRGWPLHFLKFVLLFSLEIIMAL